MLGFVILGVVTFVVLTTYVGLFLYNL